MVKMWNAELGIRRNFRIPHSLFRTPYSSYNFEKLVIKWKKF